MAPRLMAMETASLRLAPLDSPVPGLAELLQGHISIVQRLITCLPERFRAVQGGIDYLGVPELQTLAHRTVNGGMPLARYHLVLT